MRWALPLISIALVAAGCRSAETTTSEDGGGGTGSGGQGGADPVDPLPLKVVNWNVHNLIDDHDDGAQFEDFDPNWENHVSDVANVLSALDADIVVLQEVEHKQILSAVVDAMSSEVAFFELIEGNDPRGIDVCILAKFEPDEIISHKNEEFVRNGSQNPTYTYSRDALEVHLTYNTRRIVLLGVHYKSKDDDDPAKRLAEAQHTRAIANAISGDDPEAGIIILGDFNDTPGSEPYVASVDGEPTYENAPTVVPQPDRWTFDFNGSLELVDHQLSNPLLYDKLDTGSVRIMHSPEAEAASDHAPVIATYQVN